MNTSSLKKININKIVDCLLEEPNSTIAEVAGASNLSIATCGNAINHLLEIGEVIETDIDRNRGGRPAKRYSINPDFYHIACLQLYNENQVDYYQYILSDRVGTIIEYGAPTRVTLNMGVIVSQIERLREKDPLIHAIGIGVPAMVYQGNIGPDCDIKGLCNLNMLAELKENFDLHFVIENDMNLRALGYYETKAKGETENLVLINLPYQDCVGAGIMLQGRLCKGNDGFSGELSYLPKLKQLNEQRKLVAREPDELIELLVILCSVIIATVNPKAIFLMGSDLTQEIIEQTDQLCRTKIPELHMPDLRMVDDAHEAYKTGLLHKTLNSLGSERTLRPTEFP